MSGAMSWAATYEQLSVRLQRLCLRYVPLVYNLYAMCPPQVCQASAGAAFSLASMSALRRASSQNQQGRVVSGAEYGSVSTNLDIKEGHVRSNCLMELEVSHQRQKQCNRQSNRGAPVCQLVVGSELPRPTLVASCCCPPVAGLSRFFQECPFSQAGATNQRVSHIDQLPNMDSSTRLAASPSCIR